MNLKNDQIIAMLKSELLQVTVGDTPDRRFKCSSIVLRDASLINDTKPIEKDEVYSKYTVQNLTAKGLEIVEFPRIMCCVMDESGNWSVVSDKFAVATAKYRAFKVRSCAIIPFDNIQGVKRLDKDPIEPGVHIWCKH